MITLEKLLTELKAESLNEIVAGNGSKGKKGSGKKGSGKKGSKRMSGRRSRRSRNSTSSSGRH